MNATIEKAVPTTAAAPTPTNDQLDDGGTLFLRAAKRFRVKLDAKLKPSGVSACQYFLLNTLDEHGGMTQGALSQLTGIDRTALVSLIDQLEEEGLLSRNEIPEDRRANRIELTKAGTKTLMKIRAPFLEQQDSFLSRLDANEVRTLNSLLRRLV